MAGIKIGYVGGGSTRAPGCIAGWLNHGEDFAGSEIVLIDINAERLDIVRRLAQNMADYQGVDIRFSATTDRAAGLTDCDAVLSSFRPGGFEARYLDESIPLRHGVIGQETQGPGGFFMALRSIAVIKDVVADIQRVAPKAMLFNYTNPVNIVAQAVTQFTDQRIISLCEGPIIFPAEVAEAAGLDPTKLDTTMIGLNHASWSTRHLYDGDDFIAKVTEAWEAKIGGNELTMQQRRLLHMTIAQGSIPAQYFKYYYFKDEILQELQAAATTRAQDIMADVPRFWKHYEELATSKTPVLDPDLARGGMELLEIAIDVMDAMFNDKGEVWPVNVPNNGAISNLPDDMVVEVPGFVDKHGATPIASGAVPPQVAGLVQMLGQYQTATARAAWEGDRHQAIQALASNPLVMSLTKAEAIYAEMAEAHRAYLPERLLA